MFFFRFIFMVFLSLFSVCLYGQENTNDKNLSLEYIYTNYTTKDGLPSNEVYCLYQDSKGYMWFGTDRGLVRYDGYEFKTYTTLDGLTDNVVLAINEDKQGNLWYSGLNNTQLGYIDSAMHFHKYKHYNTLLDSLSTIRYDNIYFNEIYFKESSLVLVNNKIGFVVLDSLGVQQVSIKDLSLDEQSKIGTFIYNVEDDILIYSDACVFGFKDVSNLVYVNDTLVYEYNKKKCSDIHPMGFTVDSLVYIYDGYDFLIIDSKEVKHVELDYWCSAFKVPDGGYIFSIIDKTQEKQTVYYSTSPDINASKVKLLEEVRVSGVLEDSNGRIWISTVKNGIFYFPDFSSKSTKGKQQIECILPYRTGLILKLDNYKRQFYDLSTELLYPYQDKIISKEIYTGHNKERFRFYGSLHFDYDSIKMMEDYILGSPTGLQFLSDSLYYMWNRNGIFKIKNNAAYFDYYEVRSKNRDNKFQYPRILTGYCIEENYCFIGCTKGIYIFKDNRLEYMDFEQGKSIKELVYNSKIKALIYSVSGEGITIRYTSGKIVRLSQKDGLASNFINQFFEDEQGVFWVATNQGINTLEFTEPEGVKIHSILNSSKLLNSPNILQIYNKDSMLYVGTDAGFNRINLRSIERNKSITVPLRIEEIDVNGLDKNNTTSLNNLTYYQNNITFYYTALSFNQYRDIDYRYRIKGISDLWVYTKERKANFASVLPGTYTFELEVQNEYGDWVRLDLLPKFTINKPYWKTWWFIGGGLLFGLFIIGGVLYYYISNLKKEKTFVENEQMLSEELNESRQKALSSQLNPHFVFNSLNSIQNFILTKRTELSSDYLSMFSKLMRFVFENSKKLYVPLSDEISALKLYLELEQVRHNHKFEYKIYFGNLRTDRVFIPSLLIQPIIENAIWHGLLHKLEDNRLLEVHFYEEGQELNIEVKDNGIGRGNSKPKPKFIKKQESSGIELTQRRLNLLSQSTGLKTRFKVTDLFDKANNPAGTLVKITIPLSLK